MKINKGLLFLLLFVVVLLLFVPGSAFGVIYTVPPTSNIEVQLKVKELSLPKRLPVYSGDPDTITTDIVTKYDTGKLDYTENSTPKLLDVFPGDLLYKKFIKTDTIKDGKLDCITQYHTDIRGIAEPKTLASSACNVLGLGGYVLDITKTLENCTSTDPDIPENIAKNGSIYSCLVDFEITIQLPPLDNSFFSYTKSNTGLLYSQYDKSGGLVRTQELTPGTGDQLADNKVRMSIGGYSTITIFFIPKIRDDYTLVHSFVFQFGNFYAGTFPVSGENSKVIKIERLTFNSTGSMFIKSTDTNFFNRIDTKEKNSANNTIRAEDMWLTFEPVGILFVGLNPLVSKTQLDSLSKTYARYGLRLIDTYNYKAEYYNGNNVSLSWRDDYLYRIDPISGDITYPMYQGSAYPTQPITGNDYFNQEVKMNIRIPLGGFIAITKFISTDKTFPKRFFGFFCNLLYTNGDSIKTNKGILVSLLENNNYPVNKDIQQTLYNITHPDNYVLLNVW